MKWINWLVGVNLLALIGLAVLVQIGAKVTAQTPAPDTRCIITVHGVKYDVTQFRLIHQGGDIFKCNTDMTQEFDNQHPANYLERMTQYRLP